MNEQLTGNSILRISNCSRQAAINKVDMFSLLSKIEHHSAHLLWRNDDKIEFYIIIASSHCQELKYLRIKLEMKV